ncbi:hypothetical protein UF64_07020 [Thalassospira sp. HJ]|uniref:glycosyltransferase n=1 Tax=Thalassospira sp. HJ TaxID=1616823 RepID=UPI0005CE0E00|nr:glycosyltransferase [Thalassospira sp. HJ]KJE35856.1 hypothetical protein UF64_07020 [Thalassospira sp. HJ]
MSSVRSSLLAAQAAYKEGDDDKVMSIATSVLSDEPENTRALKLMARIYNRRKMWRNAYPIWLQLSRIEPAEIEHLFQAGRIATRIDRFSDAIRLLELYRDADPHAEKIQRYLELAYRRQQCWGALLNLYVFNWFNRVGIVTKDQLREKVRALLSELTASLQSEQNLALLIDIFKEDATFLVELSQCIVVSQSGRLRENIFGCLIAISKNDNTFLELFRQLIATDTIHDQKKRWRNVLHAGVCKEQAYRSLYQIAWQEEDYKAVIQNLQALKEFLSTSEFRREAEHCRKHAFDDFEKGKYLKLKHYVDFLTTDHLACKKMAQALQTDGKLEQACHYWKQFYYVAPELDRDWSLRNWKKCAREIDHDRALPFWQEIHLACPEDIEVLKRITQHLVQVAEYQQACTYWRKLYKCSAEAEKDWAFRNWHKCLRDAQFDTENQYVTRFVCERTENEDHLLLQARLAQDLGLNSCANRIWLKLSDLRPDDPGPLYRNVSVVRDQLSQPELAKTYETILQRFPQSEKALFWLARYHSRQHNWPQALSLWAQVAHLFPENIEAIIQTGRIYVHQGKDDEAEQAYNHVLQILPSHIEAYAQLTRICEKRKDLDQVADLCRRWQAAVPDDVRPRVKLARMVNRREDADFHSLIDLWQKVLEVDEKHIEAWSNIASNKLKIKVENSESDLNEVREIWQKVSRLDPLSLRAWLMQTRILVRMEKWQDVAEICEHVDRLFADDFNGLLAKAQVLEEGRRLDDAEALLLQAQELTKDGQGDNALKVIKALAGLYFRQNRIGQALPYYRLLREHDPLDLEITGALISIYTALEQTGIEVAHDGWTFEGPSQQIPDILFEEITRRAKMRGMPKPYGKSRPHVVMISRSLGPGGAERQFALTASALAKNSAEIAKVSVVVQTLTNGPWADFFLEDLQNAGIKVMSLEDIEVPTDVMKISEPVQHDLALLSCFPQQSNQWLQKLYVALQELKPDIVHAWQDAIALSGGAVAVLAGVPRIMMSTRSLRPDSTRRLAPYMHMAYRELLSLPWVAMANNSLAGLRDYMKWLDLKLDVNLVTPNALDGAELRRQFQDSKKKSVALRESYGLAPEQPLIGGVMRCSEEKRPLLWVQTMHEVSRHRPDCHFMLVGDGPMLAAARQLGDQLGLGESIHFVGNDKEIVARYAMMDALLLTSRVEGCPNVLLEAQAVGLPVVAPRVGGTAEVVAEGKSGWIVDIETPDLAEDLAERLLYILNNPSWTNAARKYGPEYVEQYFGLDSSMRKTVLAFGFK